jgi:predicted amidohydrolase
MVSRSRAPDRDARRANFILSRPPSAGIRARKKNTANASTTRGKPSSAAHAIANGCFVAVPNRVGHEKISGVGGDGLEFWGQSFVAGTSGEILAKASNDKEEILIVPVDLAKVDVTRTHWPFLRDRRIDAYGNLTKRLVD